MSVGELIQLPNKDLWRGYTVAPEADPAAEVIPELAQNPVNRAMAAILKSAAGARELTCLWCGVQGDERGMRDHLKAVHKNVTEPTSAAEAALATLAREQKPEIEARVNPAE